MSNTIVSQLFSFRGRNNRAAFAQIFGFQVAVYAVLEVALIKQLGGMQAIVASKGQVMAGVMGSLPPGFGFGLAIFVLAMSWIAWANHAKRLHDFGWSGWMQFAPIGLYFGGLLLGALLGFGGGLRGVGAMAAILGVGGAAVFALILLAMMFFRKGDEGANRFGDPDAPTPSDGGARDWTSKAAVAFVRPAPDNGFARPAQAGLAQASGESYLHVYRSPQVRASGFGRRGVA